MAISSDLMFLLFMGIPLELEKEKEKIDMSSLPREQACGQLPTDAATSML
jgi:hypothetical protein